MSYDVEVELPEWSKSGRNPIRSDPYRLTMLKMHTRWEPVDVDRLFVHTLRDLERRTAAADEYEVLLSAALLRKLLLDQERLMDQVNRRYRLDLRFRISGVSPFEQQVWDSNPIFWALEDALDPECPLAYAPFDATRDQFLGRRVMRFSESWITVRDVIDQLANIEGAVHSGKPKKSAIEYSRLPEDSIAGMAYLEW